jgi:hypothetical protein
MKPSAKSMRELETGFERTIALLPEEAVDILRLLDRPDRKDSNFRRDSDGLIRRRVQGGPTIGKVATVEAAIMAILQVGMATLRPWEKADINGSGAAPIDVPAMANETNRSVTPLSGGLGNGAPVVMVSPVSAGSRPAPMEERNRSSGSDSAPVAVVRRFSVPEIPGAPTTTPAPRAGPHNQIAVVFGEGPATWWRHGVPERYLAGISCFTLAIGIPFLILLDELARN